MMTLEDWKSAGGYFNFNNNAIFYRDEGAGEAILLIHGFPTASWDWHLVWPSLAGDFRLVAPDMLGFGFSSKPRPHSYSIAEQADLHLALVRALNLRKAHLFAHDYGDTVAQELLARALAGNLELEIRSVCFLNGGLFPGVHRPRLIQKLLMTPLGPLMAPLLGRANLARTFGKIFGPQTQPTPAEIDDFWALIEYEDGKSVIPRLIHYMAERVTYEKRWVGALKQTGIPLRLIDGAFDPISGRHLADHFQRHIPEADVVVLEGIGHYPHVEAPEAVLNHYRDFLARVIDSDL